MKNITLKAGWTGIDQTENPSHFVRLMDRVRGQDDAQEQYATVRELMGVRPGQSLLDAGCGTGGAVRAFAEEVGSTGKVTGVDSSDIMLGQARDRSRKLKLPVEYLEGDAHHLLFPDNHFDSAFALRVFEIVERPAEALNEMVRVTKPGGASL